MIVPWAVPPSQKQHGKKVKWTDHETLGRLGVLEVDAAEAQAHQPHGVDELVHILGVELDIDGVDVGEALEEGGLALHYKL
jgi:hypothetical protein